MKVRVRSLGRRPAGGEPTDPVAAKDSNPNVEHETHKKKLAEIHDPIQAVKKNNNPSAMGKEVQNNRLIRE